MQISLKWLNDYIDISDYYPKAQELADLLTNTGLEVEEVTDLSKNFDNIVIGHILEKGTHPDADKLSLCQVEISSGSVQQIVCGAKNHKQGDKVVVALPGAVLPGDFKIKPTSIRGVESCGMLCSEKELGLSEEADGIMILSEDAPVGEKFSQYRGLDDVLFELKVTPNRADCLSHFGLARELSCLLDRKLSLPNKNMKLDESKDSQAKIALEVNEASLCPRYMGRVIEGIKVGPSPAWLKTRLEAIGMNSINNVVDATNYVMMEMGQPLHAFDVREIKGSKIIVEKSRTDEKFVSLDGTEYELDSSELMIRDSERAVALAGVVGGKNSGVSDDTTELFVECAYFVPQTVRRTSRKMGIETDAAYRFSRGVDPSSLAFALDRCCTLITEIAGGTAYANPQDFYPSPAVPAEFEIDAAYLSQRIGYEVSNEELKNLLAQLLIEAEPSSNGFKLKAPLYRVDLQRKEDMVEEFARVYSYDKIPEKMPALALEPTRHTVEYRLNRMLRQHLVEENFLEALNYNFVNESFQKEFLGDLSKLSKFGITANESAIPVMNPLNADFGVMRTALVPGLAKNVQHNSRHGRKHGALFEIGYAFGRDGKFGQDSRLAMAAWGEPLDLWVKKEKAPLVLQLKSQIDEMMLKLRSKSWSWRQDADVPDFLHPGQSASLFFEGKIIGFVGKLHPVWKKKLKIKEEVVLAEFQMDALLRGQPKAYRLKSVSKMPMMDRDLAFVCDKTVKASAIMDLIKKSAGKSLKSVQVFDQFEGKSLEEGQKSLAFRMYFQDLNETLSDDEIGKIQEKIIANVTKKLNVSVR